MGDCWKCSASKKLTCTTSTIYPSFGMFIYFLFYYTYKIVCEGDYGRVVDRGTLDHHARRRRPCRAETGGPGSGLGLGRAPAVRALAQCYLFPLIFLFGSITDFILHAIIIA